jgi:uncharacterized protein YggT (Ycf19 family)
VQSLAAGLAVACTWWSYCLIAAIVISWIPALHERPFSVVLEGITIMVTPMVWPVRRVLPRVTIAGVPRDFSVCVALLVWGVVIPTTLRHLAGS